MAGVKNDASRKKRPLQRALLSTHWLQLDNGKKNFASSCSPAGCCALLTAQITPEEFKRQQALRIPLG